MSNGRGEAGDVCPDPYKSLTGLAKRDVGCPKSPCLTLAV